MRRLTGLTLLALVVSAAVSPVFGEPGNITGKVFDGKTSEPLPFSNVVIVGTPYGAMTMEDGSFFIRNVPEGTYSLTASYMGYESEQQQAVAVTAFTTTEIDFKLFRTVLKTTDEVLVTADRPMVEVDVPSTVRSVTEEELKEMPVTDIQDVLTLQAGIVESDDELHIRGGRTDETLYIIDGVRMKDRLSETSSLMQVSALAVQEMDVMTGGYSAELGDAISGIVNVGLKEGGARTEGYLEYSVDHIPFTDEGVSSYNADQIEIGMDGPEPLTAKLFPRIGLRLPGQITYFIGLSARLSDSYLPSISDLPGSPRLKSSYNDKFLGIKLNYSDLAIRAENKWQTFGTLVWKYSSTNKFKISFTKAIAIDQGYSRRNPYAVERDVSGYSHQWSRHLDHYLTYTEDTNSLALSWNQMLSENSFHVLNISRVFHCLHTDVAGMHWSEYEEPMLDGPYFVGSGDADLWHDSYTETFGLSWDITRRFPPHHQVKSGLNAAYENVQFIIISQPWVYDEDGLGYHHDLFHIYPNTGAFYVQDKINYEGLIGDIGLRYDYWFPGEQVERAIDDESRTVISPSTREGFKRDTHEIFGRCFKGHLSPRIGISFPITDRDNLFFNYGHFSQLPNYVYVYSKLSSVSSEQFPIVGNPNLNPEISVQYEIGARHQFTQTVAGNITLTYKDIYDYPTSVRFTPLSGGDLFLYINRDYARSRGIEIELKKKQTGLVGGSIAYTYSIATGKSSDPNAQKLVQESGVDVKTGETSLAEEYLWWNRPHKLNLTLRMGARRDERPVLLGLRLPSDWNLNIHWQIQSGKAYTPMQDERETGKDYSENGPADNIIDLRFTKYFKVGSSRAKIYLDVENLFNDKRVRRIDRETGEAYEAGKGYYEFYPNDSEWEVLRKTYSATDPSVYGSSRQAKLGLGIEW